MDRAQDPRNLSSRVALVFDLLGRLASASGICAIAGLVFRF